MLRRLGYPVLGAIDALLQLCVPPLRNRICYASIPDFSDNAYYLFRQALRWPSALDHVWLVRDPAMAARIADEFARLSNETGVRGHRLRVVPLRSAAGYWSFLRSRHVVHTHGAYNFSRTAFRRIRLGLWHGMPIKCIGRLNTVTPNQNPPFATHYIATSPFFRYVLAQAFGVCATRVLVVGQPRNDALVFPEQRSQQECTIRQSLGIDADARIVLWLPTYRAEGQALGRGGRLRSFVDDLSADTLRHFAQVARASRCTVLIKLHPFEKADVATELAHLPELRVLSEEEWRQTGVQLYDLLGVADALVSDVSSALIDFAITGRPLACFGFSSRTYTRDLVFPLQHLIDAVGILVVDDHAAIDALFSRIVAGDRQRRRTADIFAQRTDVPASETILRFLNGGKPAGDPTSTITATKADSATETK